jgi:hypothetical protein
MTPERKIELQRRMSEITDRELARLVAEGYGDPAVPPAREMLADLADIAACISVAWLALNIGSEEVRK